MLDDAVVKRIGLTLSKIRMARKMSLRDLSEKSGVSKSTISRYENGRDGDIVKYNLICKALGVDFRDVVADAQYQIAQEYLGVTPKSDTFGALELDETRLLDLYRQLSEQSRFAVLTFLESLPKERIYDSKT